MGEKVPRRLRRFKRKTGDEKDSKEASRGRKSISESIAEQLKSSSYSGREKNTETADGMAENIYELVKEESEKESHREKRGEKESKDEKSSGEKKKTYRELRDEEGKETEEKKETRKKEHGRKKRDKKKGKDENEMPAPPEEGKELKESNVSIKDLFGGGKNSGDDKEEAGELGELEKLKDLGSEEDNGELEELEPMEGMEEEKASGNKCPKCGNAVSEVIFCPGCGAGFCEKCAKGLREVGTGKKMKCPKCSAMVKKN